jgi:hypothetical protein
LRWTGQSRAAFARQYLTGSFYLSHSFSVIVAQPLSFTLSRTLRALDNRCGFPSAGCSALCASQPANAAVNPVSKYPVSKLKFAAGLAADPQRLCVKETMASSET